MKDAYKYLEGKGFIENSRYGDHKYHDKRLKCRSEGI